MQFMHFKYLIIIKIIFINFIINFNLTINYYLFKNFIKVIAIYFVLYAEVIVIINFINFNTINLIIRFDFNYYS